MRDPLFTIGVGLLIFGFFFLFFLPIMAFWMFAIGVGLIYVHSKTPEAKEDALKFQAEQQASAERAKALEERFQRFIDNPSDAESLEYILTSLASQDKKALKKRMRSMVIPLLKVRPLDSVIRDTVFAYAKQTITISVVGQNEASSKDVYEAALEILSKHPDQIPLKQYALEVGRWHYGIQRPNRKVTVYDEQAIQNDIAVRSK